MSAEQRVVSETTPTMEEPMTNDETKPGPLKLPAPPSTEMAQAARRLRGSSTAANWLPAGLWDELDELRAEQLRVRGQVVTELASREASIERFRVEDERHARALRQAQRDDDLGSVEDKRTSPEQREAELKAIDERLWAGVMVLAEVADAVPELVREREDAWLADLRARLVPAQEKRAELERQLAEARAEEFHVHKLGLWLQQLADDGAFGRQPAPHPEEPPKQFSPDLLKRSLERPWYRRPDAEEQPVPWLDQEPESAAVEPVDTEDETGQVSELVEHEGATS